MENVAKKSEVPEDEEDDFEEFDEEEQLDAGHGEDFDEKLAWHGDWGEEEVDSKFCEELRGELERHKRENA